MKVINCKAYAGAAVTSIQSPGIHPTVPTQFVRRAKPPTSFSFSLPMTAKVSKRLQKVMVSYGLGTRTYKVNYKYWVHAEQLDGFIVSKVVEELTKLKGQNVNTQDIYQNDKGLFDKVLDRIHQVHGKGPHDIDGKLIAVGDSIIIANGRNLIFGNVVEVTTSKVKVGIVRSTFNPKPAKVRNRTYMFPERMKVL